MSIELPGRIHPASALRPAGGEIYAHLVENQLTGLHRNLFWNMQVDFAPVTLDGDELPCCLMIDWLTWPVRTWLELDGKDLEKVQLPSMIEPSLYVFGEHFLQLLRNFGWTGGEAIHSK